MKTSSKKCAPSIPQRPSTPGEQVSVEARQRDEIPNATSAQRHRLRKQKWPESQPEIRAISASWKKQAGKIKLEEFGFPILATHLSLCSGFEWQIPVPSWLQTYFVWIHGIGYLPPVTLNQHIPTATMLPTMRNPVRSRMGRTIPTPRNPNIPRTIPAMISINPHILPARRRRTTLHNRCRRTHPNHNLRIRGDRHQSNSKQRSC
jgi:hypothetical protein